MYFVCVTFLKENGKMGKHCLLCTDPSGSSLHAFPPDGPLRNAWIERVRQTLPDWLGPAPNSFLCRAHFKKGSFTETASKRSRLTKEALPFPLVCSFQPLGIFKITYYFSSSIVISVTGDDY